jgi:hypothetical protein
MRAFWDIAPYNLVGMDQRLITLMMEAACTSETSVYSNVNTLRYIVGGSHRRTRRRENLKFHIK